MLHCDCKELVNEMFGDSNNIPLGIIYRPRIYTLVLYTFKRLNSTNCFKKAKKWWSGKCPSWLYKTHVKTNFISKTIYLFLYKIFLFKFIDEIELLFSL